MKFLGLSKCCFPEIFRWVVSEHSQPFFGFLDSNLTNNSETSLFPTHRYLWNHRWRRNSVWANGFGAWGPRKVKPERWMLRLKGWDFCTKKRNDPGWLTWHTVGGEPKGLWWLWWLWWLCSFLFVGSEMILSFHGDIFHLKKYFFFRWLVELSRLNQEHEIGSRRPVRFLTQTCSKRQPISITKIPDINV